jgi:hypothetical protein
LTIEVEYEKGGGGVAPGHTIIQAGKATKPRKPAAKARKKLFKVKSYDASVKYRP